MPLEGDSTWQHNECYELKIYLERRGFERAPGTIVNSLIILGIFIVAPFQKQSL